MSAPPFLLEEVEQEADLVAECGGRGWMRLEAMLRAYAASLRPPPVIVGLEGATLVKKHFIELAAEMAPATSAEPAAEPQLTATRIRELRANYAERSLRGNRSDLFGTDEERDELCRLALLALGQ